MKKSIFGLDENCAASIACIFTFFSGLAVLILEKDNKYVRFHAMQSTLFGLAALILRFALGILSRIPLLGGLAAFVNSGVGLLVFLVAVFLAIMAYKGQAYKLPIIGEISWEQVHK